jgi:HNH endonuclease
MRPYRKLWIQTYGHIPVDESGRSYEIHHLDGNRENNDLSNLVCVSIQEHYEIHLKQGDFGACNQIVKRMALTKEEKTKLNSELTKKNWKNPEYREKQLKRLSLKWQTDEQYKELMKRIVSERMQKELSDGTHPFINPKHKKFCNEKRDEKNAEMLAKGTHYFQSKEAKALQAIVYTCPHCNLTGKGHSMKRNHFDKCKTLKFKQVCDQLF